MEYKVGCIAVLTAAHVHFSCMLAGINQDTVECQSRSNRQSNRKDAARGRQPP